jgi:exodeoxyribonuclease V alpha subunit
VLPRMQVPLSPDQVSALEGLCTHAVSILYGGPGTGKTSLLRAYINIVSKKTDNIVCMAPTGKAAKRLADQIGRRASTIHATMDYDDQTHTLTPKVLRCDVCVVDEMSMVDMFLFKDVLAMLTAGVRLVLVGDPDQLPSIGPGQVFRDLIERSGIPAFKLTTNHRQVSHRGITTVAQQILLRQALPQQGVQSLGQDISFISCVDDMAHLATLQQLFLQDIVNTHGGSIHDTQILIPLYKGMMGISNVNMALAERLRVHPIKFRWSIGDRVIQCRNNYSKKVMNGDIGLIEAITNEELRIRFDGQVVAFEPGEMIDMQLAYAVSIHKFQGSEAPIIILPIVKQWKFFMSMDVLYTAVTRAKEHLYITGDYQVLNEMIVNSQSTFRHTQFFR